MASDPAEVNGCDIFQICECPINKMKYSDMAWMWSKFLFSVRNKVGFLEKIPTKLVFDGNIEI